MINNYYVWHNLELLRIDIDEINIEELMLCYEAQFL